MDIPWARISEMDPGQAAQVLQRYASTQGDLFPGPTVGPQGRVQQQQMPKSQQLFQSLMNQYNMIKEAEGAEASQLFTEARTEGQKLENKWSKMSRPQRIQQLKLQVEKLAAKKPYWKDIAQKELDTLEADELKTLAQAAYYTQRADQQAIKIQNMSPAEMMDAISKGVNIKQEKLKTLRDDMESLQERAKQTGAQSDKKMAAQKAIEYGIASGALPPQVSYENYKDRLQEIGGVFSKEKILSKQEFNRAKAQGMTHRSQIDRIEAISSRLGTPSRGQSGQMTGQGQGMQAAGQGQPANPSSMNPEQMQNLSVQDWQNILMQQMAQQGVGGQ